ncbi:MAG: TlpA family protein disulfide reductase [Hydrogenophilus sp.]|nr:TlpA family protein disulfide reductase [Hydrogenophilus sp.]
MNRDPRSSPLLAPSHRRFWLIAFFIAVVSLLILGSAFLSGDPLPSIAGERYHPAALEQLLTAHLPDVETGEARTLNRWRGKPLVINFWAPWCPPCQRELPDFAAAAHTYRDQVQFIGIGLDTREKLRAEIARFKLPYPTLIGNGFVFGQTVRLGNPNRGMPFTLILDAAGQPVHHHVGLMTRAELDAALTEVFARTPP